MNVACASHEYAVQLIRETRDQLVLRVLTIASTTAEGHITHTSGSAACYHHLCVAVNLVLVLLWEMLSCF